MKNYYEILEVNKKASKEVIEKAYKVLVKKYHPDLYTGEKKIDAEKKIKEINEAYNVLSDEFLKEQYDIEIAKQETEVQNIKYQQRYNDSNNKSNVQRNNIKKEPVQKTHKVGTFMGLIDLCKELYKNKPKRDEVKEITKKDVIAGILTIIIVILIGIALWYIPFTNGWMRELLFENPIFSWIGGIFN